MKLLGKIALMPGNSPVRRCIFQPGTFDLVFAGARRRGRPRNTWKCQVYDLACQAAGVEETLLARWHQGTDV